jgi:hypothetical protein
MSVPIYNYKYVINLSSFQKEAMTLASFHCVENLPDLRE